jgi:hypothetical protein
MPSKRIRSRSGRCSAAASTICKNRRIGSVKDLVLNKDGTAADAVIGTHQQINASNGPQGDRAEKLHPDHITFRALKAPVGFGLW